MPYQEEYYHPEIDEATEEICAECHGEGRVVWMHRMIGGHEYMDCMTCNGSGKTIKRPKCKVQGCDKKQDLRFGTENKVLNPDGLCSNHAIELTKTNERIEKLDGLIQDDKKVLLDHEHELSELYKKKADIISGGFQWQ